MPTTFPPENIRLCPKKDEADRDCREPEVARNGNHFARSPCHGKSVIRYIDKKADILVLVFVPTIFLGFVERKSKQTRRTVFEILRESLLIDGEL